MCDTVVSFKIYPWLVVFLQWTWGFPQTLLGFYIFSFNYNQYPGKQWLEAQKRMDAHEWGHSIQSLIFGPAYLLVIGLPSILRGFSSHWHNKNDTWEYYGGFPENWADKIGEVQRQKSTDFPDSRLI